MHIANILKDKELSETSVIKEYLTTAADGRVLDASGNSIWQTASAKLEEWSTPADRLFYRLNVSTLLYIVG